MENVGERDSDFEMKSHEMVAFQPNHALMARPERRQQDGRPQRIFFYRRIDMEEDSPNAIMVFNEAEAARIMKSSHRVLYKQIGCSDGSTYSKSIRSHGLKGGEQIPKSEAEAILRQAFKDEMEAARGHFATPIAQDVFFDESFPMNQRDSFVPPQ